MSNISRESGNQLLDWLIHEVKINHYDPYVTPPRAPYTQDEITSELKLRLEKFDSLGF
jgi:hypothetical protein